MGNKKEIKGQEKNWGKFQKITFETICYGNKKKEIRMENQNGKSENKKKK